MSDYNICGVLIHTRTENIDQVRSSLLEISGVEVHTATDDGRLVVTVEDATRRKVADTITDFQNMKGVLSAAMIYQFSDDVDINETIETEEGMSA
ncbi:MAG: chaperone NapD [Gammaproteobacteria bacterium]|nr:chaperone NapD [Gammaproteobacteria bacterium]